VTEQRKLNMHIIF